MEIFLKYETLKPDDSLSDFVDEIWFLKHHSEHVSEKIIVPEGKIHLFFSKSETKSFEITLVGLETKPNFNPSYPNSVIYAISFKPLAVEYILKHPIAHILNSTEILPHDFWDFSENDLSDFDLFGRKAIQKIHSLLPAHVDNRKKNLFQLIFETKGAMSVKELSNRVFWSTQQINRYFNRQFGLSLKEYCNIIRFRASFDGIKDGILFPLENYADQSHFIREVRRLSSVSPKELKKNLNERFIQFSQVGSK